MVVAGVAARFERERELAGWAAWTTAALTLTAFHKPKKFPKLETVVPKKKRRKARQQGWEEQKSIVLMMNAMYGGEVKKRS